MYNETPGLVYSTVSDKNTMAEIASFVAGWLLIPCVMLCGVASTNLRNFIGLNHKTLYMKTLSQLFEILTFLCLFLLLLPVLNYAFNQTAGVLENNLLAQTLNGKLMGAGLFCFIVIWVIGLRAKK